ncbi:MAG: hypothetical protein E7295_13790 [Lachnospiraceae bacterium]|jgi:hypothetical protein|nr:hypothetical protein [Lachnospiraceae bacterium]
MQEAEVALLNVLSKCLFENSTNMTVPGDVMKEAKLQAVSTLIAVDEYQMLANNMLVVSAHEEITRLLEGIPFVTVKGFASAYYYPQPLKRPMGDVDVYVDPQYYDDVIAVITTNGFVKQENHQERHLAFRKNEIVYEIHNSLKGVPDSVGRPVVNDKVNKALDVFMESLVPSARKVKAQKGEVIIPDDYHHGVIMLMHIAGHLLESGGIGLRHICDWAVYARQVSLEPFQKELKELGLWKFACQLTALCTRYLGLEEMPWAGHWDDAFLEEFMEDILKAGNFGTKSGGRILNVKMANAESFWEPFISRVNQKYPKMAKHKWLFPIQVIRYVFFYFRMQISHHRPLNFSFVKEGQKRKALYDQFCLYESDGAMD